MALFAGDIKLTDALKDPLKKTAKVGQDRLSSALGRVNDRFAAGASASGRPVGEYAPAEIGRAGELASRGIDDRLLGVLGQGSYGDYKGQRDFDRQMALAEEIGGLLSPSLAQEIFSGIGSAAQLGGQAYGLSKALGGRGGGGGNVPYGTSSNSFSYNMDQLRGYTEYPNMLRVR